MKGGTLRIKVEKATSPSPPKKSSNKKEKTDTHETSLNQKKTNKPQNPTLRELFTILRQENAFMGQGCYQMLCNRPPDLSLPLDNHKDSSTEFSYVWCLKENLKSRD